MPVIAAVGAIGSAIGGGLAAIGGGSALAGAATVAGVAGQFLGSKGAGGAAQSGANAQVNAASEANALQKYMYDTTRSDNEPWRQTGVQALARLNSLYGFSTPGAASSGAATQGAPASSAPAVNANALAAGGGGFASTLARLVLERNAAQQASGQAPTSTPTTQPTTGAAPSPMNSQAWLEMDPGYQWRLQEGVNQLDRSAATQGRLGSGGTLKALTRYNQGYASNEFSNAHNRLTTLAGLGSAANSSNSAAGQNYANQAGQNYFNAGQARASGYANQAAASGQMWGGLANAAGNIFGSFGRQPWSGVAPLANPASRVIV